jgi:hypothetical protein
MYIVYIYGTHVIIINVITDDGINKLITKLVTDRMIILLLYSVVFYRHIRFWLLLVKIKCCLSFSNGGHKNKVNCTFNICYKRLKKIFLIINSK